MTELLMPWLISICVTAFVLLLLIVTDRQAAVREVGIEQASEADDLLRDQEAALREVERLLKSAAETKG
jgi:hypothetical protein